jgi:hypothetical protein
MRTGGWQVVGIITRFDLMRENLSLKLASAPLRSRLSPAMGFSMNMSNGHGYPGSSPHDGPSDPGIGEAAEGNGSEQKLQLV